MQKVVSKEAPAPVGTYSQAIKCGDTVYLSGQIPIDPINSQLCSEDIKSQIVQVFENLTAVCKAAGGNLANIVKLTIYLVDLQDFPHVNDIMSQYFKEPFPSRTTIEVSGLPRAAKVEMDAIMVLQSE